MQLVQSIQGNAVQQQSSSPPTLQIRALVQLNINAAGPPLPTIWWVVVQLTERSVQEEQRRFLVLEIDKHHFADQ